MSFWQLVGRVGSVAERRKQSKNKTSIRLTVTELEDRSVPSASFATPGVIYQTPHGNSITPYGSPAPTGLTPTQIRHAYGFDAITFGSITGDGTGQTIAIIDAQDNPKFVSSSNSAFSTSDLARFDSYFGLPGFGGTGQPTFTKVNQSGGTTYPAGDTGWGGEIALDVEWAHALAPGANILLVEANSATDTDLFAAANYAKSVAGVSVVSMSFGRGEGSSDPSISSSTFTTPAGHQGVTFVASTGDSGAPGGFPAYSTRVVAVGGTTLSLNSSNGYASESGWSGSGGGISTVETQPSFQTGVVTQSTTKRTIPDVSFDADPNSGVPIYDSYANGSSAPWEQIGGTSFSSPSWAALLAISNQGRVANGLGTLDGYNDTLPKLYSLPSSDFHDVTTGNNGYAAGAGYDLVTGRGSPYANLVARDLVSGTGGGGGGGGGGSTDIYDPNNSFAQAANLGTIIGTFGHANESVTPGETDFYKFTLAGTGTSADFVRINFLNSQGDLDLKLFNSSQSQIGISQGTGDTEQISLAGLAAGTYYFEVYGYQGVANPNYSFTVHGPSASSGGPTTTTYSAGGLPKAIPDVSTITSTVNVPVDTVISNVSVTLNIAHTYDSDLYIYLQSPSGARVLLVNHRGGSGHNFTNTVLDSTASRAISSGSAPFTGTFRPEGSLGVFNGKDAKGTWTLVVADTVYQDSGTLLAWSLNVTGTAGTAAPATVVTSTPSTGETSPIVGGSTITTNATRGSTPSRATFPVLSNDFSTIHSVAVNNVVTPTTPTTNSAPTATQQVVLTGPVSTGLGIEFRTAVVGSSNADAIDGLGLLNGVQL